MTTRLHLLSCAATAAARSLAFSSDEPLDDVGRQSLARVAQLPSADIVLRSPARAALETAQGLGLDAAIEPLLRDCSYGRWAGLGLATVQEREPEALALWLKSPEAAPHGGESFAQVLTRVAAWLHTLAERSATVLAITHPAVVRAAIATALGSGPAAFRRIDVGPLTRARLSHTNGIWTLAALLPPKASP